MTKCATWRWIGCVAKSKLERMVQNSKAPSCSSWNVCVLHLVTVMVPKGVACIRVRTVQVLLFRWCAIHKSGFLSCKLKKTSTHKNLLLSSCIIVAISSSAVLLHGHDYPTLWQSIYTAQTIVFWASSPQHGINCRREGLHTPQHLCNTMTGRRTWEFLMWIQKQTSEKH